MFRAAKTVEIVELVSGQILIEAIYFHADAVVGQQRVDEHVLPELFRGRGRSPTPTAFIEALFKISEAFRRLIR